MRAAPSRRGKMSYYEEPALANSTDKSVEMAWVWELRDQGAQPDQALCEREGELLLGDRVVDLRATTLTVNH
jgi:hypothetical protein